MQKARVLDEQTAWAAQRQGRAYFTQDGGLSWSPAGSQRFASTYFLSLSQGWAAEGGRLYKTTDGGASWDPLVESSPQALGAGRFLSMDEGWAAGEEGLILHTADGGQTWTEQKSGGPDIIAMHWASKGRGFGWALDAGGSHLFTENGSRWAPLESESLPGRIRLNSGFMSGFGETWAVGRGGVIVHNPDGGPEWERQMKGEGYDLRSVHLDRFGYGWIAGSRGILLHSSSGGTRWRDQESGTAYSLSSVCAASPRVGWAVGQYGIILRTEDIGATWTKQKSGLSIDLNWVEALSEKEAYAVGNEGVILHTTDGGETWRKLRSPVKYALRFIAVSEDGAALWALGEWGLILKAPRPPAS